MLQEAQRTSAPRATRVSISTAVCTVMCSEPMMRAPCTPAFSGGGVIVKPAKNGGSAM